jgi:integrase
MPRRRPLFYEVRHSDTPCGNNHWRIVGFENGKRKQFWFPNKAAAQEGADEKNAEIAAHGSQSTLTFEERTQARIAIDRLARLGKSLAEAVSCYIDHLAKTSASVPFTALAKHIRSEFKRRLDANEASARHFRTMQDTLSQMERTFGDRVVSTITSQQIRSWMLSKDWATKTKNRHRGYARQIFNLAIEAKYCSENPVTFDAFRKRETEESSNIGILSAEDTEKLFRAADPEIIPYLVLLFFCGIRRATVERMDWEDVQFAHKQVVVPAYKGKNQTRYKVLLSDNAVKWLRPHVKDSGSVLPASKAYVNFGGPSRDGARDKVRAAVKTAGIVLPDNAGRHTFISMHVAYHESIDKTALEANNSPDIVKKNYLDVVTKAEAEKFWAIYPAEPVKVIPMTTATAYDRSEIYRN